MTLPNDDYLERIEPGPLAKAIIFEVWENCARHWVAARRVEYLLRQAGAVPTPPAVASNPKP